MRIYLCKFCSKQLRGNARDFCSSACRVQHDPDIEYRTPCVYCGLAANSVEHVPPKSARAAIIDCDLSHQYPQLTVMACIECNSILGASSLWTITERKNEVKRRLRRKYAKILSIPDWTPEELSEFDPASTMHRYILQGIAARDLLRARLKW